MKNKSKYNRYDVYLFLIIISAIYARYGLTHPSSLLSLLFLPELYINKKLFVFSKIKIASFFLIIWLLYAALSFLWTPDKHEAFFSMAMLLFNSLLFMEIMVFSIKANRPVQTLAMAWTCAFLITSVVALWEINTNHHLLSAKEVREYRTNSFGEHMDKEVAAFTFYNHNTYSYYICMVMPFAFYLLFQSKKRLEYVLYLIPISLIVYIMAKNSSRGGLLTMAIIFCTFIYFRFKDSYLKGKVYIITGVALLGGLLALYGENFFQAIFFRLSNQGLFEDNARLVLVNASWQAFLDSYGVGNGVGSMLPVLEASEFNSYNIYFSHNLFFEGLLEYGILFGLIFILYLFLLFRNGIRMHNYLFKSVVLGSIISFPFYSVINSENLRPTFIWLFFASVFVFSFLSEGNIRLRIFLKRVKLRF